MKRLFAASLSFLMVLAMLLALPAPAFAAVPAVMDSGIPNVVRGSEDDDSSSRPGKPSSSDIMEATNANGIVMPKHDSYLSSYALMYVNATKKNSVYTYPQPSGKNKCPHNAYHGSRVVVLAEENGYGCVLFYTSGNKLRAGWIPMEYLSWDFPGKTVTIGDNRQNKKLTDPVDIAVAWSKDYFVGTKQKFSVLDEPVEKCVEFTLDYDILSVNGASEGELTGYRTIYVNDGTGWISVGGFDCGNLEPYHVVVYLSEPMTILAVATKADCAKPDGFTFRQAILDIRCMEDR